MKDETTLGGSGQAFRTTLWTVVLRAKDPGADDRRQALDQLIRTYWKPAYFFVRRSGNDVERAKDLTQAFFTAFLEKDFLKTVSPEKGRFRSFLRVSLRHFLSDQYDRAAALKRGGGFAFVDAERELEAAGAGPEEAYFRQWAVETLSQAVLRLREECAPEDFALLTGARPETLAPHDVKNRLRRMRERLQALLRDIIRQSVELESDVDAEVEALFSKPF